MLFRSLQVNGATYILCPKQLVALDDGWRSAIRSLFKEIKVEIELETEMKRVSEIEILR